jgi:hypothetical protein
MRLVIEGATQSSFPLCLLASSVISVVKLTAKSSKEARSNAEFLSDNYFISIHHHY